ncbi:putative papain-like cysteine peptidase superfamily [Septoria linicola]|nr:putative papain-like cysteine peptidase superfamily [Septoria linicola]
MVTTRKSTKESGKALEFTEEDHDRNEAERLRAKRAATKAKKAAAAAAAAQQQPAPEAGSAGSTKPPVPGATDGTGSDASKPPAKPLAKPPAKPPAKRSAKPPSKPPPKPKPSGSALGKPTPTLGTEKPLGEPVDPCKDLETLLKQLQDEAVAAKVAQANDAPVFKQSLEYNTVARAIAAVTEAINTTTSAPDSTQFSLVDPMTLFRMHARRTAGSSSADDTTQQVARPGNEALIARLNTGPKGHYSLFYLRRTSDNRFGFRSYDSANGNWHRNNRNEVATEFRDHLQALGWGRSHPDAQMWAGATASDPQARQSGLWECGVYVIVYAWALALGLDVSDFRSLRRGERGDRFLSRAVDLIRLALQGYCSSALIEAFLKCFGVVPSGATMPVGRQFDRTVPFLTENALREHIARLRLQHDLPSDGYPPLTEMLDTIRADNPGFFVEANLWERSTGEILEAYTNAVPLPSSSPTKPPSGPSSGVPGSEGGSGPAGSAGRSGTGDGGSGSPEKPTEGGGATGSSTGRTADKGCLEFNEGLSQWLAQAGAHVLGEDESMFAGIQDRITHGQWLDSDLVFRAIAAVTEAVSERHPDHPFTLLQNQTLQTIRAGGDDTIVRVARPGSRCLIPLIDGGGHSSLYILMFTLLGKPVLVHYDSWKKNIHRDQRDKHAGEIRNALLSAGWNTTGSLDRLDSGAADAGNVYRNRQRGDWECGIHVILNAWAYALGLNFDGVHDRNEEFLKHAIEIIHLALLGRMDSQTISAFLRCYTLVRANDTVARPFNTTIRMPDQLEYNRRYGRVLVQAALEEQRAAALVPEAIPTLEEFETNSADFAVATTGVEGFITEWTGILRPASPPPSGAGPSSGEPEISPGAIEAIAKVAEATASATSSTSDTPGTTTAPAPAESPAPPIDGGESPAGSDPSSSLSSDDKSSSPVLPPADDSSSDSDDTPGPAPGGDGIAASAPPPASIPPPSSAEEPSTAGDSTATPFSHAPGGTTLPESTPPTRPSTATGPSSTEMPSTAGDSTVTPSSHVQGSSTLPESTPSTQPTSVTEPSSDDSILGIFQAAIATVGQPTAAVTTTVTAPGPADPLDAAAQAAGPHTPTASQSATEGEMETPPSDPSPSMIQTQPAHQAALYRDESAQPDDDDNNSLFEDDADDEDAIITETALPSHRPVQPVVITTPRHSPGLALPPPTPRNTAPSPHSLPGLYPPPATPGSPEHAQHVAATGSASGRTSSDASRKRSSLDDGSSPGQVAKKVKRDSFGDVQENGNEEEVSEDDANADVTEDLNRILQDESEDEDEAGGSTGPDLHSILQRHGVEHQTAELGEHDDVADDGERW